jgi:6-phosphogluconolactonase
MGDPVDRATLKPAVGTLRVYDDASALARAAADFICETAERSQGRVIIALSGGNTPRPAYELLAAEPILSRMPWERVHWIFGDERFVPPTSPDSNYAMARAAFLSRAPVPESNVHPVPTEGLKLDAAAKQYEAMLKSLYGGDTLLIDKPLIDLNLLGLGPDGHTASLLPRQPVLRERRRWVAPVPRGRPEKRISLTYPALDSSRIVAFLVAGAEKRDMLDRVLCGDASVPAGRIRPLGEVQWFIDKAAAGRWA